MLARIVLAFAIMITTTAAHATELRSIVSAVALRNFTIHLSPTILSSRM